MKWPEPGEAPARLANRLLADQAWAREKLAPFAGRAFALAVGPLAATWSIRADGTLEPVPASTVTDVRLALAPWAVPSFLANPARWDELVSADGDAAFAGALAELAHTLPWFVEEAFAKLLGPIAGQRAADAGRKLLGLPEYAAQRVAESAAGFARDEAGLIVRSADLDRFAMEVGEIEARVDALAARIDALAPQVRPIR